MHVTVAYALPYEQLLEELDVPEGITVEQAIRMSRLPEKYPEIDLQENKVGIFAKLVKTDQVLREGDRVEVYRPLPKKTRDPYAAEGKKARIRAKKQRKTTDENV